MVYLGGNITVASSKNGERDVPVSVSFSSWLGPTRFVASVRSWLRQFDRAALVREELEKRNPSADSSVRVQLMCSRGEISDNGPDYRRYEHVVKIDGDAVVLSDGSIRPLTDVVQIL